MSRPAASRDSTPSRAVLDPRSLRRTAEGTPRSFRPCGWHDLAHSHDSRDGRSRRLRSPGLSLLLAIVAALLATVGCGKKGDPQPPILLVPAPTTDLSVVHRGDELLLDLAYPQTTAAGTPLPRLAELAVWQLTWRAPEPAEAPISVDERQFLAGARPVQVLEGDDLAAAVSGDRVHLSLDVPAAEPGTEGLPMVTLAVKTGGPTGRESAFSNKVTFPLVTPPVPPTEISAEPQDRGIRIRWSHPALPAGAEGEGAEGTEDEATAPEAAETGESDEETAGAGSETPELAGFNVYRRRSTERTYGQPLRTLGSKARAFLDESALFGDSYIYTVTAVASRRPAVIESPFAEEVEVVYRDVFAPPVPQGLVALAEGGRVRLVWQESEAPDRAGYRVYRRGPDTQEFRSVSAELLTGTDFTDSGLAAGATYTYQVTAVDRAGNESAPSRAVTASIR